MRTAVIDLGTNTFNVLVRDSKEPLFAWSDKIAVRLGEGGIDRREITPQAMDRARNALIELVGKARAMGAESFQAMATSAIRDARNGSDLVEWAQANLGLAVRVVDGLEEAELILAGVRAAVDMPDRAVLIVDIGGGSTEFILARGTQPLWMQSYPLGVSRLKEMFRPGDPLSDADAAALVHELQNALPELRSALERFQPVWMIGSSGSFDTLVDLLRGRRQEEGKAPSSEPIDAVEAMNMCKQLAQLNTAARLALPGMTEFRAELMGISALLIEFFWNLYPFERFYLSRYALKEGVFVKSAESQTQI